jgi:predicted transcriptional regulator
MQQQVRTLGPTAVCIVPQANERGVEMINPPFGRQQPRIMLVLWDKGQATAREITDTLNQAGPIAHSTVQTLLRGLEKKGAITHDVEQGAYGVRTFVYRPLKNQETVRGNATREILERLFDGSPEELISYLLEHEQFTAEESKAIRAIIDKLTEIPGKKGRTRRK